MSFTKHLPPVDKRFHRAVYVASWEPDCDGATTSVWRIVIPAELTRAEEFEAAWDLIPCSRQPLDECFQMSEEDVTTFFSWARPYISDSWHEWQHPTLKVEAIHHRSAWGTPAR